MNKVLIIGAGIIGLSIARELRKSGIRHVTIVEKSEPGLESSFAAGGMLGYGIGYALYDTVGTQLLALLGMSESFPKAACYLREYGAEIIMIKGATPIPFKLLTITAGFIGMPLLTFLGASLVSRSISFMIVGVMFRLFGAPIKAFIDRYLGLATALFAVAVVAGFLALAFLGGGAEETKEACEAAAIAAAVK